MSQQHSNYYGYTPYVVVAGDNSQILYTLKRYARHWPWFLLSLALALGGAYVYLLYQRPVYKVQASLLIKDEKKGIDQDNLLKELELFAPKKVVENEMEILKSQTLMKEVVQRLGLDVQYFKSTSFGNREIYEDAPFRVFVEKPGDELYKTELAVSFPSKQTVTINEKTYPVNQRLQTPYGTLRVSVTGDVTNRDKEFAVRISPVSKAVASYRERLKVEPVSKAATVLQLSLEDEVPHKGEAVLNQLIVVYNKAAVADKNQVANATLDFIESRINLVSGELNDVEKNVEAYKSSAGITDLSTQAETFLKTVQENDAQLNQVTIQLSALQDLDKYVNSADGGKSVAPSTLGLSDPVLLGLVSKLSELESRREQIARTTSEENPLLQTLDSQIQNTKRGLSENLQSMKQNLTTTKDRLVVTNRRYEGMIRSVPQKERALLNITRQQAIKNHQYTYLLAKREETALSAASTVSDSRTVDAATSTDEPIKPVRKMIFALFGLVGILLPVGVLATKDALNNRVNRREDVETATQTPILGEVTKSRNKNVLVVDSSNRSVIAEQIRALRTNLQFLRSNPDESQVLLFTSSVSGEGKSFMSMNVGASFAINNRRTVILEMDLRKPKLHTALGMENTLGLSNYLIGEATLDDILQPVPGQDNYFILTSGPVPPNPAELLGNERMPELFRELKTRFDYVIVDSPPIGLVTDAQLIAPYADATLYIVRHDVTPKNYLKFVESLHKEQKFNRLHVVLNAVSQGDSYQYGYGYGYNNYTGYYTDSEDVSKAKGLLSRKG
ncbi:GumC family protein [Tellurirhabdus rosea]|uniref:GumC family protein n=1 Tax=Tellurirhabdus rosea TaxID=2674997 RepID=UPI00224DA38B|nr:tyrosine-protein kinase family protein [Tellurirhabdus rosea]